MARRVGANRSQFRHPVGDQRGRSHQQARPASFGALQQQQRETWIVLPRPMSSARQAPSPNPDRSRSQLHARFLIRPQRAVERRAGVGRPSRRARAAGAACRRATSRPRPGTSRRPPGRLHRPRCPRQPASALLRRSSGRLCGQRLGSAKPFHRAAQPGLIRPPPSAPAGGPSDRFRPAGPRSPAPSAARHPGSSRRGNPGCRQTEGGGGAASDGRGQAWASRPVGVPVGRHVYDHTGGLEFGDAAQEAGGVRWRPAQRMEDLAGVHHRLQPGATLRCPLHGYEQGQELGTVRGLRRIRAALDRAAGAAPSRVLRAARYRSP